MTEHPRLAELLELPAEERLVLMEALWDSLIPDPANVAIPSWHREIVTERLAEDDRDMRPGDSMAELRSRLEKHE